MRSRVGLQIIRRASARVGGPLDPVLTLCRSAMVVGAFNHATERSGLVVLPGAGVACGWRPAFMSL